MQWRNQVYQALKGPDAPRVLETAELTKIAALYRPGLAPSSLNAFIKDAQKMGVLTALRSGLFLNQTSTPPTHKAEGADYLRRGAVVSLRTVLGDCGLLNNYTEDVTCVVPMLRQGAILQRPTVGSVSTKLGIFSFHAIPEEILFAGAVTDRLELLPSLRATKEAAVCHWIYLAHNHRSNVQPLSQESETSMLDLKRLRRLSKAMGIEAHVESWYSQAKSYMAEKDEYDSPLGI